MINVCFADGTAIYSIYMLFVQIANGALARRIAKSKQNKTKNFLYMEQGQGLSCLRVPNTVNAMMAAEREIALVCFDYLPICFDSRILLLTRKSIGKWQLCVCVCILCTRAIAAEYWWRHTIKRRLLLLAIFPELFSVAIPCLLHGTAMTTHCNIILNIYNNINNKY